VYGVRDQEEHTICVYKEGGDSRDVYGKSKELQQFCRNCDKHSWLVESVLLRELYFMKNQVRVIFRIGVGKKMRRMEEYDETLIT
jgi:hypothetical protein